MDREFLRRTFSDAWYLRSYPDVAHAGVNPLRHYIRHGAAEGRNPGPWLDSPWYLASDPDLGGGNWTAFDHFVEIGLAEGRAPHRGVVGHPLWSRVLNAQPGERRELFLRVLPALAASLDAGGFAPGSLEIPLDGSRWRRVLTRSIDGQQEARR